MKEFLICFLIIIVFYQWALIKDYKWWINYYRNDSDNQHKHFLDMFDVAQKWKRKFIKLKSNL